MARKDFLNDPSAPEPTSIAVACSAFVQDRLQRILLIRRTDNGYYSIPGGQLEPGESVSDCARREVYEETGIHIDIVNLIGIYSNPRHVIAYDDGEVRQEFSICFRASPTGGILRPSSESSESLWVEKAAIGQLRIHPSTKLRIDHALDPNVSSPYYT